MNTPRSAESVAMRARSPSRAPPVRFEVGSTAKTATLRPALRHARTSSLSSEDLPAPGGPVTPTTCAGASPPSAVGETSRSSAATSSRPPAARCSTRLSTAGAAVRSRSRSRRPSSAPLGAAGVTVEARLAHEDLQLAPEALRHTLDLVAQGSEVLAAAGHRLADARRRAIGAEHVPQRLRPLAGGRSGAGGGDRRRHDVLVLVVRGAREPLERVMHRGLVARGAPPLHVGDLARLDRPVHDENAALGVGGQRRVLGLGVAVDAHYGLLARLDPP